MGTRWRKWKRVIKLRTSTERLDGGRKGIRLDLRAVEVLLSKRGSISLGSGIWGREGGGECVGVMLKGVRRGISVSERGIVKEV